MNLIGLSIGIIVGIISGVVVLAILRTLSNATISDAKSVKILATQLISIMVLIAGASFLVNSGIFPKEAITDIARSYFFSLCITLMILMFYPLYKWIYKLGNELGNPKG